MMSPVGLQVTLQRPTVVAEIGFLLAVTKFFVPTMAISGVSPIPFMSQDIYLEGASFGRLASKLKMHVSSRSDLY